MSKKQVEVVNPFDQKPISSVEQLPWSEIDSWLAQASKLMRDYKNRRPAHQRIAILKKAAAIMQTEAEQLALQIANEGGKPLIDSRVEVTRAIDGVELCIKELSHMTGTEIPMDLTAAGAGRLAFTTREPIGVVVAVSAFNHPLNLIVHQVAPAVAVGCPVIVKPANDTPLSCKRFVEILHECGAGEEWVKFAACSQEDAEKMVTDSRVDFFSFIGSARVGWMLRSKLAAGTRCALEHGGVAPVIVDGTADHASMLPALVKGSFYHAGQVCVSVQRVYAEQNKAEEIAASIATAAEKLIVGNAIKESTEVGPLIRPRETDRIAEWVDEAIQGGAKKLCGGEKLSDTTYAPTVLLNPSEDAIISRNEIFGPVVCVYSYENIDEALHRANNLPFAFQAACFTQNLDTAMRCVQGFDASAVMVNDHTAFRVDWMPFAGRRQSGYGIGGIGHTMHDMTHEKMAVIKLPQ